MFTHIFVYLLHEAGFPRFVKFDLVKCFPVVVLSLACVHPVVLEAQRGHNQVAARPAPHNLEAKKKK